MKKEAMTGPTKPELTMLVVKPIVPEPPFIDFKNTRLISMVVAIISALITLWVAYQG